LEPVDASERNPVGRIDQEDLSRFATKDRQKIASAVDGQRSGTMSVESYVGDGLESLQIDRPDLTGSEVAHKNAPKTIADGKTNELTTAKPGNASDLVWLYQTNLA
jgi:hypothetical protein